MDEQKHPTRAQQDVIQAIASACVYTAFKLAGDMKNKALEPLRQNVREVGVTKFMVQAIVEAMRLRAVPKQTAREMVIEWIDEELGRPS